MKNAPTPRYREKEWDVLWIGNKLNEYVNSHKIYCHRRIANTHRHMLTLKYQHSQQTTSERKKNAKHLLRYTAERRRCRRHFYHYLFKSIFCIQKNSNGRVHIIKLVKLMGKSQKNSKNYAYRHRFVALEICDWQKKESNLIKMMFARFYLDLFDSTDNGQFTHWSEQMCHILFHVVWFVYGQAKYSIGFINTHRISFSSVNCCLLLWKLFALFLFVLWQQSKHRA